MGTAPTGYQTPKRDWAAGNIPTASDLNRIEGNIQAVEEGQRTLDHAQAPTGNTGTLRQFLDWFANRIKAITGKTNWYDTPPTTLQAAKTHIDRTDNPHNVTLAQVGAAAASHTHSNATTSAAGFMSAADKSKLNGVATGATNTPLSSSTPSAEAVGSTGAAGSSTSAARADHRHAMPTATDLLNAIKTVDGAGSGLDADLLRGLSPDLFLRAPIIGSWKPTSNINIAAAGAYTKDIALGAAKSLILSVCRWNVAARRISDDTSPTNGSVAAVVLSTPSFFAGIGGLPGLAGSYSAAEIAINTEFWAYMNSSWSIDMRLKVEMVNDTTLRITFTNIASNCNAIVYANSPGIVYAAI